MPQPIASKPLGLNEKFGLQQRLDVWNININARKEEIIVEYDVVLISPTGEVTTTLVNSFYKRFNSRSANMDPKLMKIVTKDNLKFEELRASEVGQMIAGMVALDLSNYTGPQSLEQMIFTDPQPEN